jgi:hypothetical protein
MTEREKQEPKAPAEVAHDKAVQDVKDARKAPVRTDVDVDHDVDADAAKEEDRVLAEAKKLDDEAREKNEQAEHDVAVKRARTVFADGEEGPDGTAARRLSHPGEVTDRSGNPDPFGTHVNVGTALDPDIREIAGLHPDHARRLGLPTGVAGGAVADSGPVAPEEARDEPVEKEPATKK